MTVTTAQSARILDAFKAQFGTTTTAETITAYERWLTQTVRDVVLAHESRQLDEAANTSKRTALAALTATLPDPSTIT